MLVFSEVVTIHVKTSITSDLPISLDLRGSPATAFELVPKQSTGDGTVARFECEVIASKNLVVFMKWPAALFARNVMLRAAGPDSPIDGDFQPAVAIISKKDVASAHRIIGWLQLEHILLKRYPIKVEEAQILLPAMGTAAVRSVATSQSGWATVQAMQRYLFPRRTLAKTGYEAQSASFVQWWCSASMTHGEIVNSIDDTATRMVSSAKSRAELLVILLKANMGAEGASIPVVLESPPGPGRLETLEWLHKSASWLAVYYPADLAAEGRACRSWSEDARNALRDGRRKALVQYFTQHPVMRSLGIVDEGGLSEQFLIDAEMGSGLETTRIK
ncbi:hypothetical protein CGCF415_v015094 [Colletotrichum fructicola]|nr:hypothetical protein CGCF415_v015094 [Colletotrichum fructicola]KAF4920939.1 hypothetical protein CGCF245_v015678 [Colletotrichum fructicola]